MPTYQYACTNPECGNRFEQVQAFTDAAITECPVCGTSVRKVFSAVGVVFKGSGFYRNDSRTESPAKVNAGKDTSVDFSSSPDKTKETASSSSSSSDSSSSSSKDSSSSSKESSSAKSSGSAGKAAASA